MQTKGSWDPRISHELLHREQWMPRNCPPPEALRFTARPTSSQLQVDTIDSLPKSLSEWWICLEPIRRAETLIVTPSHPFPVGTKVVTFYSLHQHTYRDGISFHAYTPWLKTEAELGVRICPRAPAPVASAALAVTAAPFGEPGALVFCSILSRGLVAAPAIYAMPTLPPNVGE